MVTDLAITCGGTGGHFYPGLSVARAQMARGGKVTLLLSGKNSLEQSRIASEYQVPNVVLPYMPSPSTSSPGSIIRFAKGLYSGIRQAHRIMRETPFQVLLGMGSFASVPAIYAAHSLRIPIVLHDGNARIGKANRWFSRWAVELGTAFPAVNGETVHCPLSVPGMPLRPELKTQQYSKSEAIAELNRKFSCALAPDRFTILLFGGSQGARKLNECFGGAFKNLAMQGKSWQIIHLTGRGEWDTMQQFWEKTPVPMLIRGSLNEMYLAYQAADLVIARSGGSSVAELNAFGKYAVVVPYPYASEGHQLDNANYLVSLGAAEVVDNAALTEALASEILMRLNAEPDLQNRALRAVRPDAWQGSEKVLAMLDRAATSY